MLVPAPERITIPGQGEATVVPAVNLRGCVDPRLAIAHNPEAGGIAFRGQTEYGEVRSAGADLGDVAVILAAMPTMSPQEAVRMVAWAAKIGGRKFTMHNDTGHADQEDRLGGCGHYGLLVSGDHESAYGVDADRMRDAGRYAVKLATAGAIDMESTMLEGPHQNEVGVLVVTGREHTVATELADGSRFFRHDTDRHHDILNTVAAYTQAAPQELEEIADNQRDVSLVHLAPGRPIYLVDLANYSAEATLQGFVPAAA